MIAIPGYGPARNWAPIWCKRTRDQQWPCTEAKITAFKYPSLRPDHRHLCRLLNPDRRVLQTAEAYLLPVPPLFLSDMQRIVMTGKDQLLGKTYLYGRMAKALVHATVAVQG